MAGQHAIYCRHALQKFKLRRTISPWYLSDPCSNAADWCLPAVLTRMVCSFLACALRIRGCSTRMPFLDPRSLKNSKRRAARLLVTVRNSLTHQFRCGPIAVLMSPHTYWLHGLRSHHCNEWLCHRSIIGIPTCARWLHALPDIRALSVSAAASGHQRGSLHDAAASVPRGLLGIHRLDLCSHLRRLQTLNYLQQHPQSKIDHTVGRAGRPLGVSRNAYSC